MSCFLFLLSVAESHFFSVFFFSSLIFAFVDLKRKQHLKVQNKLLLQSSFFILLNCILDFFESKSTIAITIQFHLAISSLIRSEVFFGFAFWKWSGGFGVFIYMCTCMREHLSAQFHKMHFQLTHSVVLGLYSPETNIILHFAPMKLKLRTNRIFDLLGSCWIGMVWLLVFWVN